VSAAILLAGPARASDAFAADARMRSALLSLCGGWTQGNADGPAGLLSGVFDGRAGTWSVSARASADSAFRGGLALSAARDAHGALRGYVLGGALLDHPAGVEGAAFAEAGAGIAWFEGWDARGLASRLTTGAGFRYLHQAGRVYPERRFLGARGIAAPRMAVSFVHRFSDAFLLREEFEVLADLADPAGVRGTSTTTAAVSIAGGFALIASFDVRYAGAPPAGVRTTDLAAGFGAGWVH